MQKLKVRVQDAMDLHNQTRCASRNGIRVRVTVK